MTENFKKFSELISYVGNIIPDEMHDCESLKSAFMNEMELSKEDVLGYIDELDGLTDSDIEKMKEFAEILTDVSLKDSYGGEGQGEEYWSVYYFPKLNLYVKFEGYYQSHHGAEYESCSEVIPKEVTKTEYVSI